jgi:hypothetical protein
VQIDLLRNDLHNGRALLSPLRIFYDAKELALPLKFDAANAPQDLTVDVIDVAQGYRAANEPTVTIPTNIDVAAHTAGDAPGFYASLIDRVSEAHPGAVVVEYAGRAIEYSHAGQQDLLSLGGDRFYWNKGSTSDTVTTKNPSDFILTRLHLRYGASTGDRLELEPAKPIEGGDEKAAPGARPGEYNHFQARYVIRHPWTVKLSCPKPERGRWETHNADTPILGPVPSSRDPNVVARALGPDVALDKLELVVTPPNWAPPKPVEAAPAPKKAGGCCDAGGDPSLAPALLLLLRRRRR